MSDLLEDTAVTERLRRIGRESNLSSSQRLTAKVDLSPAAVTNRLRIQSQLRDACLRWIRIGQLNGLNRGLSNQ
jgi:hypothetical protein